MKHIQIFEEFSKNDPIPEITTSKKLAIILLGQAGIGKSTFANNFIIHKNRNIKIFSTDDVSLTLSRDPNIYRNGSSELNIKRLKIYMKSGGSFIYDTTGILKENIEDITKTAKENSYDIIYIHLIGTLDLSLKQNSQRSRNVDDDFLRHSYHSQFKNMNFFSSLNPNKYYIVYNIDGKYKFMQYKDGELLKRKVDKYVRR